MSIDPNRVVEIYGACLAEDLPDTDPSYVIVEGIVRPTRVVYAYAARLQVQERIGAQVVDCIQRVLTPYQAVCIITASHDCMRLRGVRSPSSVTTTVATRGLVSQADLAFIQQLHLQHAR